MPRASARIALITSPWLTASHTASAPWSASTLASHCLTAATLRDIICAIDSPPGKLAAAGWACTVFHSGCFARAEALSALAKQPLWKTVQAHPAAASFPGGESMAQMMSHSVAAVRQWDAKVEADHGADAVWLAVSHGDVIKAILADALGMHLDLFQRIVVDPSSTSVIRYTPLRPFVVSLNSLAGDLRDLKPVHPRRRTRRAKQLDSDAAVGGGSGELATAEDGQAPPTG